MSRVVVVTGGTRGIGNGLVREFLRRGAHVAFCGREQATVDATVASLDGGEAVVGVAADVREEQDLQRLWDSAVSAFGRVDVWINNAGMSAPRVPFPDLDAATARTVVEVNLLGVMNGSRVALRGFAAQGGGDLWNMEGFGSDGRTVDGIAVYGATKSAVTYLTKALRKDLAGSPVGIHLLSPGIVATDLLVDDYDGRPDAFTRAQRIFNILGDRVETVTPWLAERVLATAGGAERVAWLTPRKATGRFLAAGARSALRRPGRDIFAEGAS